MAFRRFREPRGECLPDGSPARKAKLPLIHMLAKTLNYPDAHFARDLAVGMPIVGPTPSTKVLKERTRDGAASVAKWKGAEFRNGTNKSSRERKNT